MTTLYPRPGGGIVPYVAYLLGYELSNTDIENDLADEVRHDI